MVRGRPPHHARDLRRAICRGRGALARGEARGARCGPDCRRLPDHPAMGAPAGTGSPRGSRTAAHGRLAPFRTVRRPAVHPGPRCSGAGGSAFGTRELRSLAADGFAALPRNDDWIFEVRLLADANRLVNEPVDPGLIYEHLAVRRKERFHTAGRVHRLGCTAAQSRRRHGPVERSGTPLRAGLGSELDNGR